MKDFIKEFKIFFGYFITDPFFIAAVMVLIIGLIVGIIRYQIKKNDRKTLEFVYIPLIFSLFLIFFAHCRALIQGQNKINEIRYEELKVDNTGTVIGKEIYDNDKYYIYVSKKYPDKTTDTLKIGVDLDVYSSVDIGSVVDLNDIFNIPDNPYESFMENKKADESQNSQKDEQETTENIESEEKDISEYNTGVVVKKATYDNGNGDEYFIYVSVDNNDEPETIKIDVNSDIYSSVDIGSVIDLHSISNVSDDSY